MTVSASYYDGKTSRRHLVTLSVTDGVAQVRGEVERDCPIAQLRVSERLNRAARKVSFPDGAYLEIIDAAAFSSLLRETGHRDSLVVRLQQSWRHALAACAALVAVVVLSYLYLLPLAAQGITALLPVSVDRQVGQGTLDFLDQHVLAPSQLDDQRARAITSRFRALATPLADVPDFQLVFRKSRIGPNAFALPSGQIVVTDDIVQLLDDDDALMGVLAHELGHVHRRHLMRRLIQSSAIAAAATLLFGDVSAVLANIPTVLLDLKYSRDIEREADDYAIAMFKANGLPRQKLALVFEKLEDMGKGKDSPAARYLSSHPANEERIAHILGAR
ncbi:M48 family metallopeptidase [Herbaspirillum aquaticum]|jgi:Zn-dependent protease with chaperone function|uniref:Zn-dependent protease n=1 Tax=Herbaspirillum aquaticum TaxID=568783 RepID=A0A225SUP9_9BURK|nr:M48 family metallopeptidase [Herbaspirillum aquaticum]MBW9336006.1 M48 family metallopeptidase [Herbaspirillum sp. RU 5E]OWY34975.1 Zn-dependent protease [Herbaspirillum aquaticum]